ncbi:hypothetical protein GCM10010402_00030 [Actinomadura luteofluorescens]
MTRATFPGIGEIASHPVTVALASRKKSNGRKARGFETARTGSYPGTRRRGPESRARAAGTAALGTGDGGREAGDGWQGRYRGRVRHG